jgi:4-amino-4-deoxy-L-arabinose transferase-like glycosyltransferase
MKKLIHNNPLLVVLLIGSIILLSHLSSIPTNIMETRNIVTAREMITHDNWFLTTLNELPRYEKPPLPTWLTAIFGYLFGFEDLFYLRLPVVIASLLMLFWFFKLNIALKFTKSQSLQNSLILISSFYVFFSGRDNNWDMYTHSFMIGSIYHWVKYNQEHKKY